MNLVAVGWVSRPWEERRGDGKREKTSKMYEKGGKKGGFYKKKSIHKQAQFLSGYGREAKDLNKGGNCEEKAYTNRLKKEGQERWRRKLIQPAREPEHPEPQTILDTKKQKKQPLRVIKKVPVDEKRGVGQICLWGGSL